MPSEKSWADPKTLEKQWRPVAAKFARAVSRLQSFSADIVEYFESDAIRPILEPRPGGRIIDVYLVIVREPPLDLSVTVGEVLHNLRSSLNLALFVMWPQTPEMADFPIAVDETSFNKWTRRHRPPETVAALLRSMQPFATAPDGMAKHSSIEILRVLNNTDKHRGLALLPVGIAPRTEPVMLAEPEGLIRHVVRHLPTGNLKRRTHAYEVHLQHPWHVPDIGVRMQGTPMALETYFPAQETLAGIAASVEYVLRQMHEFTTS